MIPVALAPARTASVLAVVAATLAAAAVRAGRRRRRVPLPHGRSVRGGVGRHAVVGEPAGSLARTAGVVAAVERGLGRAVRALAGRPADPGLDRRVGRPIAVGVLVLVVGGGPLVAAAAGLATWAVPVVRARGRRRRTHLALLDEVPEVVDLVRLAVASGLNVRLALDAVVAHHRGGAAAHELAAALTRADRGERLADALDHLVAGPGSPSPLVPLVDALVASERYGAPVVDALDRVAADARLARRRHREEVARRVPVKLLFPLVFCTLPAFTLLTVVPVLLRSLPTLAP